MGIPGTQSRGGRGYLAVQLAGRGSFGLSLVAYSADPSLTPYNQTTYDGFWQLASIGFSVFGLFILLIRRPNGWGYGMAVFLLAFAGHLLHMMFGRDRGEFPRRGAACTHGSLSHPDDPAAALPRAYKQ